MRLVDADKLMKLIPSEEMTSKLAVANAPTVDAVEVKHGVWIDDKGLYRCSVCNNLWTHWWIVACPEKRMYKEMKFCPNCGAKMDEVEENETR